VKDHSRSKNDTPYALKGWDPCNDGIPGATGSNRAAGELGAKARAAGAVGLCVADCGSRVVRAERGVEHESVGDDFGDVFLDGHGAGCGDEAEQN
jgi:hypothetical protein